MRLNKKFLSESLAGSEALKLEDWGAFNIEFRLCLGFKGDGAGEGLQGIICHFWLWSMWPTTAYSKWSLFHLYSIITKP